MIGQELIPPPSLLFDQAATSRVDHYFPPIPTKS
jgi:hypothetical protein